MTVQSSSNMELHGIQAPDGSSIQIPCEVDDASDPYLRLETPEQIRDYYDKEGYVVIRNLIPAQICDDIRQAYADEIKPYPGFIYRQATANPERNVLTESGFVRNSILNLQDLSRKIFPRFSKLGVDLITHEKLTNVIRNLYGEPGKIVQSMYFDGNSATWAHQDSYYLDSVEIGKMVGVWIALEDIRPGAGRFFIYPKSHLIDMPKNGKELDIAFNHSKYKTMVLDVIKSQNLECRAPALRRGDVLLWGAKTIHGSLETNQPTYSRSSVTAHFIPQSHRFLQFQAVEKTLHIKTLNGLMVHCPKDQNVFKNRAILAVETTFPKTFRLVKRLAIKAVTG